MKVLQFLLKFWYLFFVLFGLAGVGVAIALNGYLVWPFLIVLTGILFRTLYGLAAAALEKMKGGELPDFDKKYVFSLVASIALDILAMVLYVLTHSEFLGQISGLTFTLAFLVGYGEAQVVRDSEKLVRRTLGKPI